MILATSSDTLEGAPLLCAVAELLTAASHSAAWLSFSAGQGAGKKV